MGFKQKIIKDFKNPNEILLFRYEASKIILVIMALLFFMSFFFVGAGYNRLFFIDLVGIFYLLLIISFDIFVYLFFSKVFGDKFKISYKILLILFIILISIIISSPILYEGGPYGIYNDFLK